jgi:hypothetical protein
MVLAANARRRDEPSPEIAQDCRTKRDVQHMCQIDDEYCFHTGWCGSRHVMLHIFCTTAGPLERKAPARLGPEYRHTIWDLAPLSLPNLAAIVSLLLSASE